MFKSPLSRAGIAARGRKARRAAMLAAVLPLVVPVAQASAHVVLETKEAPAHSFFRAPFLVGHGCDGSSTIAIEITIPDGVTGVKPMPKPGWTLSITDAPYAQPLQVHGKTVTSGVKTVSWSGGPLPDAWTDEFFLTMQLPDRPAGTVLHFPVVQRCESGTRNWTDIAEPGAAAPPTKSPAPALTLIARAP
jgi:uncharacterized protein YcnI